MGVPSTGSISCSNGIFGDPAPGVSKACFCEEEKIDLFEEDGTCGAWYNDRFPEYPAGPEYKTMREQKRTQMGEESGTPACIVGRKCGGGAAGYGAGGHPRLLFWLPLVSCSDSRFLLLLQALTQPTQL